MIKQTITVEDIMSMDLIKSTGSWKNARKMLKRLFDICLEQGFLVSWEFSGKKKVDSYRSLHRAKIHLYYANAYSAARFGENLQRALAILDEEMYVKETARLTRYVEADALKALYESENLEAAKDLASEALNGLVDAGVLLDWDVDTEPDSIDALLDLDVTLVFMNEEQKEAFFHMTPEMLAQMQKTEEESGQETVQEEAEPQENVL